MSNNQDRFAGGKMLVCFKVEETLTATDWAAFVAANAFYTNHGVLGNMLKGTTLIMRVLGVAFMLLGGVLAVLSLLSGHVTLLTLIGAACVWGGFSWFRKYKNAGSVVSSEYEYRLSKELKKRNVDNVRIHIAFEDDTFFAWESGKNSSYYYSAVSGLVEDSERYYLYIAEKMQFILQKAAFTSGDPEEFRTFIGEKTGQPVITVK